MIVFVDHPGGIGCGCPHPPCEPMVEGRVLLYNNPTRETAFFRHR